MEFDLILIPFYLLFFSTTASNVGILSIPDQDGNFISRLSKKELIGHGLCHLDGARIGSAKEKLLSSLLLLLAL